MQKDKMKEFLLCAILKENNILGSNLEFKTLKNCRGRLLTYKVNFLLLFISLPPWLFCKTRSCPELCLISLQAPCPSLFCVHCILFCELPLCQFIWGAIDPSTFPPCVSTFTEDNSVASYMCNIRFCR